ncbi:MAG: hypothetical protein KF847_15870 [Pirellulales bacterium]|nr:hypothetical protein [Pirellulales bacterium]
MTVGFTDIHCHLLPGVDDGAADLAASLAMAGLAVADGTRTIVVTPHQLGNFAHNHGDDIRRWTCELQTALDDAGLALEILPGADVRIDDGMVHKLLSGEVLTLGDHGRHVLLELPHETYLPLEGLLAELKRHGITGILSHPERNRGLLNEPELLPDLVEAGCLMQVTAGSLVGTFGADSQRLSEWMLRQGLIHVLASDGHSPRSRRPLLRRSFDRAAEIVGRDVAETICSINPALVAAGRDVPAGRLQPARRTTSAAPRGWRSLFSSRRKTA